MANSFICLNIHVVFSTKHREKHINQEISHQLWAFMGGIANQNKMVALAVGGMEDHAHLLLSLPGIISTAKAVQLIKTGSSKWIHENFSGKSGFAWQSGYAAFSVSPGRIQKTREYIMNQDKHHQGHSFQEEYIRFLKDSGIDFDERYIWG